MADPAPQATETDALELFETVAHELASGRSPQRLIADLVRHGWDAIAAREFVAHVQAAMLTQRDDVQVREAAVTQARRQMQSGIIWVVGGFVARSIIGAAAADNSAQLFAFAAMAFGAYELLWGGYTWQQLRNPPELVRKG